ncbi:prolipoprotein diacylglyceryl transferase [Candidatus Epulonipiscium fishelsonii]|uniref:Prolipoprotein diacylglyceryl transferase n=1 Tax=Candidatus Epulonipiscium fishelsonii TaxID=77094 RepID=A0ACC8XFX8_9FIRM|nr:prolipoprotein diacylglyceryl transferase [Epulopiscium sp. SCG-B11WGA-EpuloA1]
MPSIYFPNLGVSFNMDPIAFNFFGLPIYWYGIIITLGIMGGLLIANYIAKREGLNPDIFLDFLLYDIVFAIIGARAYFVLFNWDYYSKNKIEIFNLREGGIAIYGAILVSIVVAYFYTKKKKVNMLQFGDIAAFALLVGQAIGRYGNFFNREAFGGYTDNFLAMQILKDEASTPLTPDILENIIIKNGFEYVQVHPTFFYESTWNLCLLGLLLLYYNKVKRAKGEIFFLYIAGYGIGRYWVEGLRTDQLIVKSIGIPASQIVAILSILIGVGGFIYLKIKMKKDMYTTILK